jgi:hypothetical protein
MFLLIYESINRKMNGDVKAEEKKKKKRVDQIEWDMRSVNSLTSKIELKTKGGVICKLNMTTKDEVQSEI